MEITGAQVDIDEDNSGKVNIYATSEEAMNRAIQEIDLACGEIEEGKIYRGIVKGVKEFGCFVEALPGKKDSSTFPNSPISASNALRMYASPATKWS